MFDNVLLNSVEVEKFKPVDMKFLLAACAVLTLVNAQYEDPLLKLLVPAGSPANLYTIQGPVYIEPSSLASTLQYMTPAADPRTRLLRADAPQMRDQTSVDAQKYRYRMASAPQLRDTPQTVADSPLVAPQKYRYRLADAPQLATPTAADVPSIGAQKYRYRLADAPQLADPMSADYEYPILQPQKYRYRSGDLTQLADPMLADAAQAQKYRMSDVQLDQMASDMPSLAPQKFRYRMTDAPQLADPMADDASQQAQKYMYRMSHKPVSNAYRRYQALSAY